MPPGGGVVLIIEDRLSDSPYVERVWRAHSEGGGSMLSIAESRWEMVVTRHLGKVTMTVRGPETRPTRLTYNSVLLRGDVPEEVAKLKREPGNELQVHGSAALTRTLMEHDLIDEYRLFIHPVVLGNGRRLFAHGTTPAALTLTDTKTTGRGVVVHVYQPSGKPEYGSTALE